MMVLSCTRVMENDEPFFSVRCPPPPCCLCDSVFFLDLVFRTVCMVQYACAVKYGTAPMYAYGLTCGVILGDASLNTHLVPLRSSFDYDF